MKTLAIDTLVSVSQQIGASVAYAQGGGGNTSIKYQKNWMLIKASGSRLAAMQPDSGYSIIHTAPIDTLIRQGITDARLDAAIANNVCPSSPHSIPSIETSLHILLGRCVIHCHSIYANVLNCSYEGESIIQALFPEALCIPYTTVGPALAQALYQRRARRHAPLIFLQNHGLIVQADDMHEAHRLHTAVQQKIQRYLAIDTQQHGPLVNEDITSTILFPDQLVYLQTPHTQAYKETLWAFERIRHIQHIRHLTPRYLSPQAQQELSSLSSETHRQRVAI